MSATTGFRTERVGPSFAGNQVVQVYAVTTETNPDRAVGYLYFYESDRSWTAFSANMTRLGDSPEKRGVFDLVCDHNRGSSKGRRNAARMAEIIENETARIRRLGASEISVDMAQNFNDLADDLMDLGREVRKGKP